MKIHQIYGKLRERMIAPEDPGSGGDKLVKDGLALLAAVDLRAGRGVLHQRSLSLVVFRAELCSAERHELGSSIEGLLQSMEQTEHV